MRELPIWGVPPFDDHNTQFHYDFAPSLRLKELICEEMSLVSKDFDHILKHWRSLKFQVDRHLDLLIQFRVIEQQQLALHQSDLAVKQQIIAVEEAKTARAQAQSVSIFTFITVVFLPLSFFTSYFGIHLTDVDGSGLDSHVFWSISGPFSVIIILIAVFAVRRAGMQNKEPDDLESAGHMPTSRFREWAHQFSRIVPQMTKDKEI